MVNGGDATQIMHQMMRSYRCDIIAYVANDLRGGIHNVLDNADSLIDQVVGSV